jgi:hypothetical protein
MSMQPAKTQPSPQQEFAACDSQVEGVEAAVDYLVPGSRINRRYVAPGAELNTGRYAPHTIFIRNGRPVQSALGLDTQGFVLAKQPSLVSDFRDRSIVDAVYPAEVERIVKAPHTSFRDPSVQNAAPRESIEFRTIAYFL